MNLRYPRTVKQSDRASSNRNREKGLCTTVTSCLLVVARHGVFSIEEISTVPLGKGRYSSNHEVRRGLCTIAPLRISDDPQRAHVHNPTEGDGTVNVFMTNSNSSESLLVDSKLPL
jgi:hypothetical protein